MARSREKNEVVERSVIVRNLLGKLRRSGVDEEHLRRWAAVRHGVEAFVEPRTTVTATTVVLVAHDGEWTRRPVAGPGAAQRLARGLGIPVYDVQLVGYPQRMRDHDARERILRRRGQR